MVTADSLNYDCLELIFAHLLGNDLVSVSLVSRSFLAGVIPRLYRTLSFKLHQAKRYPAILSPFACVLAHPNLSNYVRHIDVRAIPTVKASLHPVFLRDCSRTIHICKNLVSFTCTPNALPSFLLNLQERESLQHLRINANLTADQAEELSKLTMLRSITLDAGSSPAVDMLPRWTSSLSPTLTTLTLYSVHDLNECVLETVLMNLPELAGLFVIGCPKVDHSTVLRLSLHTSKLESLGFTNWESPRPLPMIMGTLKQLRHLTIDTHCTLSPTSTPTLWTSVLSLTRNWSCPLKSVTLRLSDKLLISDTFIQELLDAHETTLTHISFSNCALSTISVRSICMRCTALESFVVNIPVKDIYSFAEALARSSTIQSVSDLGNLHSSHGQKVFLSRSDVSTLMKMVPSLRRVVSEGRVWMASKRTKPNDTFELRIERRLSPSDHWFMPPEVSR